MSDGSGTAATDVSSRAKTVAGAALARATVGAFSEGIPAMTAG